MELNEAMQGLEVTTDDQDINVMMRRHAQEREVSCDGEEARTGEEEARTGEEDYILNTLVCSHVTRCVPMS